MPKIHHITSNTAITLIALIITIIVLLILAGITLNMVMGKNGIISKAGISKEQTNQANALEKLNLKMLEYNSDKINNTNISIKEYLSNIEGCTEVYEDEKQDNLGGYIVVIDGYEFRVDANGKVIEILGKATSPKISITQNERLIDVSIIERGENISSLEILNSDKTVLTNVTKQDMTQNEKSYGFNYSFTEDGIYIVKVTTRRRKAIYKRSYN